MKKILLFIFTFGIIFSLYNVQSKAYAAVSSNYGYYYYNWNGTWFGRVIIYDFDHWYPDTSPAYINQFYFAEQKYSTQSNDLGTVTSDINNYINTHELLNIPLGNNYDGLPQLADASSLKFFNIPYRDFPDGSTEILPPPEPENSWWDEVASSVGDYFNAILELGRIPVDFWEWIWGSPDVEDQPEIDIYIEQTPTPLPTEIPYSTIINPSTGEIQYKYEISGTPIITSQPPPVATYIITLPPDAGIAMPTGVYYSDDGLQDVIDAMDDNLGEYTGSIETIRDSFSTLPVKWFAFFGIPAAFLIIAGVIKSLLG